MIREKLKPQFSENALIVLCERYLHRGNNYSACARCGERHETPEALLQRVSLGNPDYYNLMAALDFLPNSPTLFNLGIPGSGTLSACFKFDVSDSLDSIMEVAWQAALVQKWGGGVGYYLGYLRPKGAPIASTHGKACGPVSVMKHLLQGVALLITQGGRRQGAQMAILDCAHPDIREFIHAKDADPQSLDTFNISVACTDGFMREALYGNDSPEKALLWEMAHSAWKTGDPGCYFVDAANRDNPTPWLGSLTGTNPCGEVPLLPSEACNLGSINLKNHLVMDGQRAVRFDLVKLATTARTATRFLDDILDHNTFPVPAVERATRMTRKLGLGVMGWADALMLLGIPYDSNDAVSLGGQVMGTIWAAAHQESLDMAYEKGGPYPGMLMAPEDFNGPPIRNATVTCIAPTGTISILAGASSGIEPHYALTNTRRMGSGTVLIERVEYNGFKPKTSLEIDWRWHIEHQAAFQKYVDLAVSKTCNLRHDATVEDVFEAYGYAWAQGCKGVTIFRDRSRTEQVLESLTTETQEKSVPLVGQVASSRSVSSRPPVVRGETTSVQTGHGKMYITVNFDDLGKPFELFGILGKAGGCDSAQLEAVSRLVSLCLRSGVSIQEVSRQLKGISCCPTWNHGELVHSGPDAIAIVLSQYDDGPEAEPTNVDTPSATEPKDSVELPEHIDDDVASVRLRLKLCPNCGADTIRIEGCLQCISCAWSRCD